VHDQRNVVAQIDNEISDLRSQAAALAALQDPQSLTALALVQADIRHLELTRLIERNRLMALEREAARYRAQLAAGN
jgi:hypothetical protein